MLPHFTETCKEEKKRIRYWVLVWEHMHKKRRTKSFIVVCQIKYCHQLSAELIKSIKNQCVGNSLLCLIGNYTLRAALLF